MDIGELSFIRNHEKTRYAVNTGYAEVSSSKVTALVESAERSDMIDLERAKRAKQRAEEKLTKLPRKDETHASRGSSAPCNDRGYGEGIVMIRPPHLFQE